MEFFQVVSERRSIRRFEPIPVEDDKVQKILETGILAPTAGNVQPWFMYVVKDSSLRQRLSEAARGQASLIQAPVVIVICADPGKAEASYGARGRDLYTLQDTAALTLTMIYSATAMGLGTVWVGAFDETQVSEVLQIPSSLRPVAMIPVGYPAEKPQPKPRKPVSAVTKFI